MSQRDSRIALRQMLDHAREALAMAEGLDRPGLEQDRVRCLALVRLLEILGEAARRVPREVQAAHGQVPWSRWISLRNRLIHAYDQVDLEIVAKILVEDVPELARALDQILSSR